MSFLKIIPERPCYIAAASCICPPAVQADIPGPRMADEPDYKPVIADANLRRRMGRILKMSVACGLDALGDICPDDVAGIVTFTGMGFMKDTISFGNSIYDRGEDMLNPSPFMQSTFNTASGYIALIRKIKAYNTAYVQQAAGFAAAFADAVMLLSENPGRYVLAAGFDEVTPEVDILRRRLGLNDGMPLGEGAGAFLLSDCSGYARLCGMAAASDNADELVAECMPGHPAVNVIRCSTLVPLYGASYLILAIVMADRISRREDSALTLYVDDVNMGGLMALVSFSGTEDIG